MSNRFFGRTDADGWTDDIRVSVLQTELFLGDIDSNLHSADRLTGRAAEESPDLCVLPEVFATGFPYQVLPDLVNRSDEVIGHMSDSARDHSMNIIFTQVIREGSDFFNRLYLMGRDGRVIDSYDKTHLFSRAGEDRFFTPGKELKTISTEGVSIGALICYEVRFPELSRTLIMEGAHLLVYPAQWPSFRTFQWETLLRARSIENQCYVVGVNGYGKHGDNLMGGQSRVYSPFGNKLASVGKGEGFSSTVIGPGELKKVRENIPCLEEIRHDLIG